MATITHNLADGENGIGIKVFDRAGLSKEGSTVVILYVSSITLEEQTQWLVLVVEW